MLRRHRVDRGIYSMSDEDILQDDFFGGPTVMVDPVKENDPLQTPDSFPIFTTDRNDSVEMSDPVIENDPHTPSVFDYQEFPVYSWKQESLLQQSVPPDSVQKTDGMPIVSPSLSPFPVYEMSQDVLDEATHTDIEVSQDVNEMLHNSTHSMSHDLVIYDQEQDTPIQHVITPSEHISLVESQEVTQDSVVRQDLVLPSDPHIQVDHTSQLDSQGWVDEPSTAPCPEPPIPSRIKKKPRPVAVVKQLSQHEKDVLELEKITCSPVVPLLEEQDPGVFELPLISIPSIQTSCTTWTPEQSQVLQEPRMDVTQMTPPDELLNKNTLILGQLHQMKSLPMETQTREILNQREWHYLIVHLALSRIVHGLVSWPVFVSIVQLCDYYQHHHMKQQAYEHTLNAIELYKQLDQDKVLDRTLFITLLVRMCYYSIETNQQVDKKRIYSSVVDAKIGLKQLQKEMHSALPTRAQCDVFLYVKAQFTAKFGHLNDALDAYSLYYQSVHSEDVDPDQRHSHSQALLNYAQMLLNMSKYQEAIQVYITLYHFYAHFLPRDLQSLCKTICQSLLSVIDQRPSKILSSAVLEFSRCAVHYSSLNYETHPTSDTYEHVVQCQARPWLHWRSLYAHQQYAQAHATMQQWLPIIHQHEPRSKRELDARMKLALCDAALGHCGDALRTVYKLCHHALYKTCISSSSLLINQLVSIVRWSVEASKRISPISDSPSTHLSYHETALGSFLRDYPDFRTLLNELTDSNYEKQQKQKQKEQTKHPQPPIIVNKPTTPKPPPGKPLDHRPRWRYP